MHKRTNRIVWAASLALALCICTPRIARAEAAPDPRADYDVKVELENGSGEKKTNWPVILTVYRVFGRDIPAGSLNPKGYHVYNDKGDEIEYTVEEIPPLDQQGNNELVFIVPAMDNGQKLVYRITNTAQNSAKLAKIDFVNNPNNLLKNAGFEQKGKDGPAEGWTGHGTLDGAVKRSGNSSLLLAGLRRQKITYTEPIALHKGSLYYFGIWGKTDHVSRHALYDSSGGYFHISGFDDGNRGENKGQVQPHEAGIEPQCATRDWWKSHFITKSYTDWGLPEECVTAEADSCPLFFMSLDQRPQFVLPDGHCEGKWWLDDATLFEQPKVRVRFDLLLEPKLENGLFLFSRPSNMNMGNIAERGNRYCAMPYPREKLVAFDRDAVKGQRVPFLVGLYAKLPARDVRVSVKDNALAAAGTTLPVTEIEYCRGFLGKDTELMLRPHTQAIDFDAQGNLPYFVVSFLVPRDAKPGKYTGAVEVTANGKLLRSVPITLRVQDMELPVVRDISVAGIFQGGNTKLEDAPLKQYAKSGYTGVTRFGEFFKYTKSAQGKTEIDLVDLGKKLEWLKGYGITAAVTPFSDADLGPLWGGGSMFTRLRTKEAYMDEVKRVEDFVKEHPDLPRVVWMTWDEPNPDDPFEPGTPRKAGSHGGQNPRMGWPNEACQDAWTTVDAGFWIWDKILPYYTYPILDEPANFCGPELYAYTKKQGKNFGFAGQANVQDERARYQVGIMMIGSGARIFHFWHVGGSYLEENGQFLRALYTVATGEGIDDLKIHRLLEDALKDAKKAGDKAALVKEVEDYLAKLLAVWNADHTYAPSQPYLGLAGDWGYDQFYQDWQAKMLRYAAALRGAKWGE